MVRPNSLLVPAAALLLSTAAAAGTITVGPTGSGASFDDIADAIAAAQPGDTILVSPGQYVDATPLVVDKPLTILGAGSDTTSFQAVATSPFDKPLPLYIVGLQAGEEVRVAGLTLRSQTLGGFVASAFVVENCVGPVVLSDISSGSLAPVFDTAGLGQVRSSPQVLLDGCELRVLGGGQTTPPTPALVVENSEVHVNGTELLGGSQGMMFNQGIERDGAPGILASGSTLRLSRTESLGGAGTLSSLFFTTAIPTQGGAGIEASGSFVFLRGGSGNLVQGGAGKSGTAGGVVTHGLGGAAVEADALSLTTSTSDAQLVSGADSTGLVTVPLVGGGAAYLGLSVPLATLESTTKLVAPGATAGLELGGEPGGLFLTYFSVGQGAAASAPPIHGQILLDTQAAVSLATTTLDAAGAGALSVPIPSLASLAGLSVLAQGFSLGTSGEASFSSATSVAIR